MPDPHHLPETIAQPFECSCTDRLDADWVYVAGALDIATTPQLAQTLSESQARLVVLDMRDLAFMDCSAVHAIVDAGRRARTAGRRLLLVRGPEHVDRIFSLTGHALAVDSGVLGPVEPSTGSIQRSLVSSSLLRGSSH